MTWHASLHRLRAEDAEIDAIYGGPCQSAAIALCVAALLARQSEAER